MALGGKHMLALVAGGFALAALPVLADTVGVTDKEIKIGNINPYSGPASAYGVIGKTVEAYFKKINDEGGINGRKIDFITYDDHTVRRKRSSRPESSWRAIRSP